MANKKINELLSRTPSLTDLMLVGDPSSGYSYKCTITALATIIETDIADGYVTLSTTQTISGAKTFSNVLTLTSVANAATTQTKFLTLNGSNVVNYRTGAEVLSDIGAADDSLVVHKAGTETITGAKTFNAGISLPNYVPINLSNNARIEGYDGKVLFRTVFGAAGWFQDNSLYLAAMDNITDTSNIGVLVKNYSGEAKVGYKTPAQMLTYLGAQGSLTLTTTGTSGAATLVGNTLNIPQYQEVLTNPVTGTGTTNYIPKFTSSSAIGNSVFTESGGNTLRIIAANAAVRLTGSNEYILQTVDADGRFRIYDQTAALERVTLTSSGNLGLGTSSPSGLLDIQTASNTYANIFTSNTNSASVLSFISGATSNGGAIGYNVAMRFGTITGKNAAGFTERMRLDASGNLLVGGTSASYSASGRGNINIAGSSSAILGFQIGGSAKGYLFHDNTNLQVWNEVAGPILFGTSASERMRLDASGNLGLGVTPSAWGGNTKSALEFANGVSLLGNLAVPAAYLNTNAYSSNGGSTWLYKNTDKATQYIQYDGQHLWYTAASGTAGNTISFTQAMTLDASGRLGIGTTSPTFPLTIGTVGSDAVALLLSGDGSGNSAIKGGGGNLDIWSPGGDVTLRYNNSVGTKTIGLILKNSSGNVGIGTTSPTQRLHIYESTAGTGAFLRTEEVGGQTAFFGVNTSGGSIQVSGANPLQIATNGSERMRITSGGDVGVGTSSPQSFGGTFKVLEVQGSTGGYVLATNSGASTIAQMGVGSGIAYYGTRTSADVAFTTNNSERMRITSGGSVGIGTSTFNYTSATRGQLALNGATDVVMDFQLGTTSYGYIYAATSGFEMTNPTNNPLKFITNNVERMRITGGGNVLVGTTTDVGAKLRVNGNVSFENSIGGGLVTSTVSQLAVLSSGETDLNLTFSTSGGGITQQAYFSGRAVGGDPIFFSGQANEDGTSSSVAIGDITVLANGTNIRIDDAASTIEMNSPNITFNGLTSSGSAGSLVGYITIKLNNTSYKIPYYNL